MTGDEPCIGIEHEDYLKPEHHKKHGQPTNDRKGKKKLLSGHGR